MKFYYLSKPHSVLSVTQYKEPKYYFKKKICTTYAGGKALCFGTIFLSQELPSTSDCSTVLLASSASVQMLQTFPTAVLLCSKNREKAGLSADNRKEKDIGPQV